VIRDRLEPRLACLERQVVEHHRRAREVVEEGLEPLVEQGQPVLLAGIALAGADGLVMFNRFYQPDIDIKTLRASPQVELSTSAELLLRLRWLAILHGRVRPSLAVTGGVATPSDGIKAVLAGAHAVQMVSALLRHGPAYVSAMRLGLEHWMEWNKMTSLDDVRGRVSLKQTKDPAAFERANYIRALQSWNH